MKQSSNLIQFVILGFLVESPLTGYEIKGYMENSTRNFINASYGSIYPTLKVLLRQGSITMTQESQGKRIRKVHEITPKGREEFLEWLRSPLEFSPFHHEHLARMFFFRYLKSGERIRLMEGLLENIRRIQEGLVEIRDHYETQIDRFQFQTVLYGIACYQQDLDWYEEAIRKETIQIEGGRS